MYDLNQAKKVSFLLHLSNVNFCILVTDFWDLLPIDNLFIRFGNMWEHQNDFLFLDACIMLYVQHFPQMLNNTMVMRRKRRADCFCCQLRNLILILKEKTFSCTFLLLCWKGNIRISIYCKWVILYICLQCDHLLFSTIYILSSV